MARILVVDDDRDHRETVGGYLSTRGHDVHFASDGRMAISILKKLQVDYVLLDLSMPVMGGLDSMEEIQRMDSDTNIIIVTGLKHAEKYFYYENGCILFETKPVDLRELELKIKNFHSTIEKYQTDGIPEGSIIEKDIHEINEYILENADNYLLSADTICQQFKINKNQLYKRFGEVLTISLHDQIRNIRMLKAMELIRQNACSSIRELSFNVGYRDPGYFSRIFNKSFGTDVKKLIAESKKVLQLKG